MKKKRLFITILLSLIGLLSISCTPNIEEKYPQIGQYKSDLKELYNEIETKYAENPTPEDWDTFSQDWVPRLTRAAMEDLNGDVPEEAQGKVSQLNDTKNNLMYLWNQYNNKITGKNFKEETVKELKESIEKSLK